MDMVLNMLHDYTENLYWVIRMGVFLAAGTVPAVLTALIGGKGRGATPACMPHYFLMQSLLHCMAAFFLFPRPYKVIVFGYIHIRYGIGEYAAGISRLFAMTETATDYRAMDMVLNMLHDYTPRRNQASLIILCQAAI